MNVEDLATITDYLYYGGLIFAFFFLMGIWLAVIIQLFSGM